MKTKDYCTQNAGICETCSLVNYFKDCRNIQLHTIEDLCERAGYSTNELDMLNMPSWVNKIIKRYHEMEKLEDQIERMKLLLKSFAAGVYKNQEESTLLAMMGLEK